MCYFTDTAILDQSTPELDFSHPLTQERNMCNTERVGMLKSFYLVLIDSPHDHTCALYRMHSIHMFTQSEHVDSTLWRTCERHVQDQHLIFLKHTFGSPIPDNCYRHHGRCPCKNILSGVKFFRLNTKLHIFYFSGSFFSVFGCF